MGLNIDGAGEAAPSPGSRFALATLSPLRGRGRIAVMCSEKHPLDCHRCLHRGRALAAKGTAVQHILSDGSLVSRPRSKRNSLGGGDLFASRRTDWLRPIATAREKWRSSSHSRKLLFQAPTISPPR